MARPLPVEYLLVDVPASTPLTPIYTFSSHQNGTEGFPIENRYIDGQIQEFNSLSSYLSQSVTRDFLDVSMR